MAKGNNVIGVVVVGLGLMLVLCAGLFTSIVTTVSSSMTSNPAYVAAMDRVRASSEARSVLGEPIEEGMMPSGSIQSSGTQTRADLRIGVSGPTGEGTIYVKGTSDRGAWTYDVMELVVDDQRIDLR